MRPALRRAIWIGSFSAVLPVLFLVGWKLEIAGLYSWPRWLFYLWPTAVMFLGWTGAGELKPAFFITIAISLGINLLLWIAIGLPLLWLLVDLPQRLRKRERIDA